MNAPATKNFNLPWHQRDQYWLCVYPGNASLPAVVKEALSKLHLAPLFEAAEQGLGVQTGRDWKAVWNNIHAVLTEAKVLDSVLVSLTPERPSDPTSARSVSDVQQVADSMWLGDALLEDRVVCYLQPVMSAKDKVFGYESFARVKATDGSIIAGDKIVAASKALGIEYTIDKHLQVQAIRTFASSAFNGFLFVNFFPGFIQRPAVYLEGLSDTAKGFGIVAKHIVLDFTKSETPRDIAHLKSVCDYARSRGYSIALDDVSSVESVRKLIGEVRPDFIKIDMALVRKVTEAGHAQIIREISELAHGNSGTVVAEGVETEEMYNALRTLGVDLYQGYLFSPPVPVEAVLKRNSA